jgi:Ca2+-binding RTX toxin-like protein
VTVVRRAAQVAILMVLSAPSAASASTVQVTETTDQFGGRSSQLTYTAMPSERNQITVTRGSGSGTFGQVFIRDEGAVVLAGYGCTLIDVHEVRCGAPPYVLNGVELQSTPAVAIDAGDGDDTVTVVRGYSNDNIYTLGGDGADVVTGAGHLAGGAGNDVVTSTSPTPEYCDRSCDTPTDVVAGGAGDDVLRGGLGDELLIGDSDSQRSPDLGGGNDVIDGGGGGDVVSYAARHEPVQVDLSGVLLSGSAGERDRLTGVESVTGGPGADVLLGSDAANGLNGGPGDDMLDGRGGNDRLSGDGGADMLFGRAGDDELVGEQQGDVLYGGPGNDRLWNPIGASLLFARVVHCGSGRDVVATPQGQPLAGCEEVRLGDLFVQAPRRLRNGRLRVALSCNAGMRCEVVVKLRRGSTLLSRKSIAIPFGRSRTLDLRPRARVRSGQTIDIAISGRDVVSDATDARPTIGSIPIAGRWRMRLG